jgi:hypothetical protein
MLILNGVDLEGLGRRVGHEMGGTCAHVQLEKVWQDGRGVG